jgi:hypothetical protein
VLALDPVTRECRLFGQGELIGRSVSVGFTLFDVTSVIEPNVVLADDGNARELVRRNARLRAGRTRPRSTSTKGLTSTSTAPPWDGLTAD